MLSREIAFVRPDSWLASFGATKLGGSSCPENRAKLGGPRTATGPPLGGGGPVPLRGFVAFERPASIPSSSHAARNPSDAHREWSDHGDPWPRPSFGTATEIGLL